MTRAKFLLVAFAPLAWMIVTAATPYDEAERLYESGRYLEAASLAEKANTASSLALAARASLAYAIYVVDRFRRPTQVKRGSALASKALALDPTNVEAHLQLVIALYEQTRATSPVSAYFRGLADKARFHLDEALHLDPANPWAYSLLGGWHFEVVRLAGPALAKSLLGASVGKGRIAFAKAAALMPESVLLQYFFARTLLLNDLDTNRVEAVRALNAALAATPMNHLETLLADRARAVLDAVNLGSSEILFQLLDSNDL